MFNDNDRGQVGIGTLIVFIAMVLVAAIAAGVLINTAGFLQAQSEATGEESAEQVSDRVQVSSVVGAVSNESADEEMDAVSMTVLRGSGADDINLENAIIEVFAEGESATLTFDGADIDDDANLNLTNGEDFGLDNNVVGEDEFAIVDVTGADDGTLSDSSDRAKLVFDLGNVNALEEGETVTITVTTAAGGSEFIEKRAPSTLEEEETYLL